MTENLADLMPFSKLMGIQITEATKEKVSGSLTVRPDLCTTNNIMHGGAMMAFADTMGAIAASFNLPEGANGTTTIESKTNFLRAAPEGATITAVTTPVNVGRRLSVWQTKLMREDGKPVAVITQSQMVL